MLKLWYKLADTGVTPDMDPFERRAIGLINRISTVSILIFLFFGLIPSLWFFDPVGTTIPLLNILAFGLCIRLNHRRKYQLSRYFLLGYGLCIVSLMCLLFQPESLQHINYLSMVIIPVMVFRDRTRIYFFYLLTLTAFILTTFFHFNYEPWIGMPTGSLRVNAILNVGINLFIVTFALIMFFRGLQEEYQEKLEAQNRQLARQKEEIAQQHQELQQTHKRLQSMQSQLVQAEKMASLGQLTAGIAHEINNPINFVSGSISPLRRDCRELGELIDRIQRQVVEADRPEVLQADIRELLEAANPQEALDEIRELLDSVEEGARRTEEIVAGLRNFSRLSEDGWKQTDLHQGMDAAIDLLHHRLQNRITIEKNYGDLPAVPCIPGRINQVFMNILGNAIDAMPEGGRIHVRSHSEGGQAVISIRDEGEGMAPEVIEKIFDPFFTTKAVGKGTGLGLSIAYGIVEQHGGRITVESRPGKGSEFEIRLPTKRF